ncbi:hypothetical protein GCM10011575_00510 [Microlunatus endophyticus]|uniref:Aminoglycoside phosphotransferase domain-containing protein n=1 Tax=Microlunatus endophyticus TaxID=1716077 RepID=A0A917VYR6_9ACTN|nr:phosphotransferase [Microlunatus endophyticus]GGL46451.1 hypothetical protein GCM10011575_00510 [Microlunatus endophyticus]
MKEIELTGGRITPGVVRIGNTVRRPRNQHSDWINRVLIRLEELGYPYAPRYYGVDDQDRDILSFIPGVTTDHPSQRQSGAYRIGGGMLRQLHELTRRDSLITEWPESIADRQCILHGDPGAYNAIFQDGSPVALIDWDAAHPGNPVDDLAYMAWTWCIQSAGNVPISEQAHRLKELADGYQARDLGLSASDLLDRVVTAQQNLVTTEQRVLDHPASAPGRRAHATTAIAWATADRDMIRKRRADFVAVLKGRT